MATRRDNASLIEMAKAERKKFPADYDKIVYIEDPKAGKALAKWCRVRDQGVEMIKGDEAAMMTGTIKVEDSDGKEIKKEMWKSSSLSQRARLKLTGADIRDARSAIRLENGTPSRLLLQRGGWGEVWPLDGRAPAGGLFPLQVGDRAGRRDANGSEHSEQNHGSRTHLRQFHPKEVESIAGIINAGSLPAVLESTPVRDTSIEGEAPSDKVPLSAPSH